MSVSVPLVCHRCWPTRTNWNSSCDHVKEVIDRVYVGRPVSALENELDARSDECFELRQDVKRLEGEANELRAKLARTTSNVAALVDAARDLADYVEIDVRRTREETGLTLTGAQSLLESFRAALGRLR